MSSIKTIALNGTEVKAEGMGGQNTIVRNLADAAIYASVSPGVTADADGVAEIPPGGGVVLYDTHGTVYLSGKGKVQLTGTDYSVANFKVPPSSNDGGGVICSDVIAFSGMVSDDVYCFYEEADI